MVLTGECLMPRGRERKRTRQLRREKPRRVVEVSLMECKVPSECPHPGCGEDLEPRGGYESGALIMQKDGTVEDLLQCSRQHLIRVIYKPIAFFELTTGTGEGR